MISLSLQKILAMKRSVISTLICSFALTSSLIAQDAAVGDSSPDTATAKPTIVADVVYGHKMGMALTLDVVQPPKQNGAAVIFMVSGGWNSNWFPPQGYQRVELLGELVDKGYVVILLRHGSAPLFKVPDAVSDVKKAIRFLHEKCGDFGFDANRIGVCGMSAGGHLSLMLGTDTNASKSLQSSLTSHRRT
jgi:acetyl esterase/lipase